MDDIKILSDELQRKSLSSREIVLKYHDAMRAIDTLYENNWIILGWEVWFKYPNGQISHFFEHGGTTWIEASDWDIDKEEEWKVLVKNLAERCKHEIAESETYWREKCEGSGVVPYFCIIATDSLSDE